VRFLPPFLTFHPAHVLCCMMWWTLYPALGCKGSGASAYPAVLSLSIIYSVTSCLKQAAFFCTEVCFCLSL